MYVGFFLMGLLICSDFLDSQLPFEFELPRASVGDDGAWWNFNYPLHPDLKASGDGE